jgi:SAM-dependent methyltransferase
MSATLYGPEFFAGRVSTVVASASVVVPLVAKLLDPRTVLDVGCGQGEWLDAFAAEDCLGFGVDIAAPDGPRFLCHDLAVPLDLGRRFDLVVSLETGEHLPASDAGTFVDSLVLHGDTILFSAATEGQEGIGHVNCRPHDYWHGLFVARGFTMSDPFRPQLASESERVSPWYRENLFLYARAGA